MVDKFLHLISFCSFFFGGMEICPWTSHHFAIRFYRSVFFFPIHVDGLWSWQCKTIYVQQSFFFFVLAFFSSLRFLPRSDISFLRVLYTRCRWIIIFFFSLSLRLLLLHLCRSPSPIEMRKNNTSLSLTHISHISHSFCRFFFSPEHRKISVRKKEKKNQISLFLIFPNFPFLLFILVKHKFHFIFSYLTLLIHTSMHC